SSPGCARPHPLSSTPEPSLSGRRCMRFPVLSLGSFLSLVLGVAPVAGDTPAADGPVVYKGARILTAAGPAIERGAILVHGGKVRECSPAAPVWLLVHA